MKPSPSADWLYRFVKGMFIGAGAILPGVSGGALAAVFGLYERLISFIANITKDFFGNVRFFLPVGLGGVFGVFVLSFALSFLFENAETQIVWFFIGCIAGIFPALYKQATKNGSGAPYIAIAAASFALSFYFLYRMKSLSGGSVPLNVYTWTMAGGIFALGMIVPGLSPSNFLVYLNMYKPMTDAIKTIDLSILLPMALGAAITIISLSKLVNWIFQRAYAAMFHVILGVVLSSTLLIVPLNLNYRSFALLGCAAACVAGIWLGAWMSRLEERYK